MNTINPGTIQAEIAKGSFRPNMFLTNMSMAFFQAADAYVSKSLFPILPVDYATASYYIFSKEDLARDNVQRKPQFGKVAPFQVSNTTDTYAVEVDQIIMGIDKINQTNISRLNIPGASDPRKSKVRTIAEQMNIHQDIIFANAFFKKGAWDNEWTGVDSNPTGKQVLKFADANFEPIKFFDERKKEMLEKGRREPNKLGLGVDAFNALKENGDLLERIKYSGSSANPAIINERIIAEMLGLKKVVVFKSTYNNAAVGQKENMQFICDPASALLCYATDAPAIDEPSAGYTFTWDMLGDGNYLPVRQFEGEEGTHSEFIEGLMATSHKKTCDELGMFFTDIA